MNIPWFSTVTLCTEILVTTGVLYTFYSSMRKNYFPKIIVSITLGYEILFNISYMAYRAVSREDSGKTESALVTLLALFHGIFSLIMFVALLVFMIIAWIQYTKGINFFANHKKTTYTFIALWLIAVFSGIAFYFITYF